MKILYFFVLLIGTAGLSYAYSSTAKIINVPYDKPYEPHVYADGVVTTPSKVMHAFFLGLLYNTPPVSR